GYEGRFGDALGGERLARLGEIDVAREIGEADALANLPRLVKQRVAPRAKTGTAAEPLDSFALSTCVALRNTAHALGGDVSGNIVPGALLFLGRVGHLNQHKAAWHAAFRVDL